MIFLFPRPTWTARSKIRSACSFATWPAGCRPQSLKLDWEKIKETQREKAARNVKASLLLEKISDREAIRATKDEVDREVQTIGAPGTGGGGGYSGAVGKGWHVGPYRRPHPNGKDPAVCFRPGPKTCLTRDGIGR